jgi:CheY-like chemotaxis protein
MAKKKVYFIIDDDLDDQLFLIEALTKNDSNIQCFKAGNGKAALQDLKKSIVPFPEMIFLDLNMPQMNGKQCLIELKLAPFLREIPVIIYSTSTYKKEIQECLNLGAFSFMTKKSSFRDLCQELLLVTSQITLLKEAE